MSGVTYPGGLVVITPDAVAAVRDLVDEAIARRGGEAGLSYAVHEAVAALRTAVRMVGADNMFVRSGPIAPPRTDMPAPLRTVTTAQLARDLVHDQVHVRRLAAAAGVVRVRRGVWPADAAATIRAWKGNR
jgi:hypothetical protein